jgi:hypothetical protein
MSEKFLSWMDGKEEPKALQEVPDWVAKGNPYAAITFFDNDGVQIPSWDIRLAAYLRRHEEEGVEDLEQARKMHLGSVARALCYRQPVPQEVIGDHDQVELEKEVAFLRCGAGDQEACRVLRELTAVERVLR